MSTEQINIRIDTDLVAALERVAREESIDRATAVRRLLETSLKQWQVERALGGYQRGELSLGRAAEEAGLTQWEILDRANEAGLAHPLTAAAARRRLDQLLGRELDTLPDVTPGPGGVLLVGINPAPISVAAGHYYQGRLGRRLWRRLERLGLLHEAVAGAEDEAFARAGHGLTDLVKRPTKSAAELGDDELREGVAVLHRKIGEWQPGLVLFAFKAATRWTFDRDITPGRGPDLDGVPTFLLTSPYAPAGQTEQNDAELRQLLGLHAQLPSQPSERTQRVTAHDLAAGRIRLPRPAKRLFPSERGEVEIVLRGARMRVPYDPRTGSDRERSAVLSVPRQTLQGLVRENEVLAVTRGAGGVPVLG